MINKFVKKFLIFFSFLLIFIAYSNQAQAAGCNYICNSNTSEPLAYCQQTRGSDAYLGTTFSTNNSTACTGQANCGLGSVPVCCCTGKTSIVTPTNTTKTSCSWMSAQTSAGNINGSCPTGNNPCQTNECVGANSDPKKVCCYKPITTAASSAKFKLPDYVFQIPIGKLVKLTTVDCSGGTCQIPFISQYVSAVYVYGLSVAGILGVLVLMAAGLLWLVSGGDSGKITTAKNLIFGSVTGLLLLVGLSLFLSFINPDLIKMKSLELENIERIDILAKLAAGRNSGTEETFKNANCASDAELAVGVDFYATGYYKPVYSNDADFFCVIAMQCSCPGGSDTSKTCDIYRKTYPNYHPCKAFSSATPYCNMTSTGSIPQMGDIAGPKCANLPKGTLVCFKGKTYRITDSGGGIKGKRIDIWSGSDLKQAYANTGTGKLTIGACK